MRTGIAFLIVVVSGANLWLLVRGADDVAPPRRSAPARRLAVPAATAALHPTRDPVAVSPPLRLRDTGAPDAPHGAPVAAEATLPEWVTAPLEEPLGEVHGESDDLEEVAAKAARLGLAPHEATAALRALVCETETARRRALVRSMALVADPLVRSIIEERALVLAHGASTLERRSGLEVLAALGSKRGAEAALTLLGGGAAAAGSEPLAAAIDALPADATPGTARAALASLHEVVARTNDAPLRRLAARRAVEIALVLGEARSIAGLLAHADAALRATVASALESAECVSAVRRTLVASLRAEEDAFARECMARALAAQPALEADELEAIRLR